MEPRWLLGNSFCFNYPPNSRKILTRAELDQKEQGLTHIRVCDNSIADHRSALSAACTVNQKPITTTWYSIATLTLYCDPDCLPFFFSSLLGSSWRQLETAVIIGLRVRGSCFFRVISYQFDLLNSSLNFDLCLARPTGP